MRAKENITKKTMDRKKIRKAKSDFLTSLRPFLPPSEENRFFKDSITLFICSKHLTQI